MKAFLLHPDRDFDLKQAPPPHERDLTQDLELNTLLAAMAGGDSLVREVARKALLAAPANDAATISYRQQIVRDCLRNAGVVSVLYALATEAIENRRKHYFGIWSTHLPSVLHGAVEMLQMLIGMLERLRALAELHATDFESRGMTALFAMLRRELGDDYLAAVRSHLERMKFRAGVLISAGLGEGNAGRDYVLRFSDARPTWLDRLLQRGPPAYTFHIHPRDEAGGQALSELRSRGINLVANALAQSADHVISFFEMLRAELAFYVGCINLHERLAGLQAPVAFPRPLPPVDRGLHCAGLYDVCLALAMQRRIVGNAVDAEDAKLVVITGANQGGKSSFLRGLGLAQLMMQAGLFVGAESFAAPLAAGLFTHYKREEDATMKKGKLDEELARMSELADLLRPDSLVLFNESFAATNEREGSEIARQVISALLEKRVRVFFVTHLYEFAHRLHAQRRGDALFLRAERQADGTRTFKLIEAEPLQTSYGEDVYREVFAAAGDEGVG
jgi:hypothetical protein